MNSNTQGRIYNVSASPHLHDSTNVKNVMWNVVLALMPALIVGIYFFGFRALALTIYSILAAVITEAIILFLRKKPIVINDGSAIVTGILVAFNIHAGVPWWIPVVGSVFAIAIGKHTFGGLGNNLMNPALLGRAFLVASWPTHMTSAWVSTKLGSINGMVINNANNISSQITSATPLAVAKTLRNDIFIQSLGENGQSQANDIFQYLTDFPSLMNMFFGNIGGCIGEVSAIALLIGALFLLIKHII